MRDDRAIWIERLVPASCASVSSARRCARPIARAAFGAAARDRRAPACRRHALALRSDHRARARMPRLARAAHASTRFSVDRGGFPMTVPGSPVRRPHARQGAGLHARRDPRRSPSASAPPRRSSRSSITCCCGRCRIPARTRVVDVNESATGRAHGGLAAELHGLAQRERHARGARRLQEDNLTLSAGDRARARRCRRRRHRGLRRAGRAPAARPRLHRRTRHAPGAAKVVALSHALWQRGFGADPGLVGRSITLEGEPYTVVGVMPERFDFPGRDRALGAARARSGGSRATISAARTTSARSAA